MAAGVWVLGGHQSDFARNLAREGVGLDGLVREVVEGTLAAAGVSGTEVGSIHVGNAFGQLFTGQGHLGAMPATVHDELWGTPAGRHEAACASGSIAVLAAMAELASGAYDCSLVLGVEIEKTQPSDEAARTLGAAAWVGHEAEGVAYVWPHTFARVAEEYAARYEPRGGQAQPEGADP
jgi:acetyl-CoA C-acetyltransferase